jgi:hypothetical protein
VVRLDGDRDIDAWAGLADAIHQLAATPVGTVTVDVAAVRFVGAVFPNFLAQVRQVVPAMSLLTVSRPSLMARFVLTVTDMAQSAKIDDALPAPRRGVHTDTAGGREAVSVEPGSVTSTPMACAYGRRVNESCRPCLADVARSSLRCRPATTSCLVSAPRKVLASPNVG